MRYCNTKRFNTGLRALAIGLSIGLSMTLTACGGGGGSDLNGFAAATTPAVPPPAVPPPAPLTYRIGGTVTGLETGQTVALQNNGGDTVTVSANGVFAFTSAQQSNTAYGVSVSSEPTARTTCTVSNGSGTVGTANVSSVGVSCVTQHVAYVANFGNNAVMQCSVSATGALTGCAGTGSGFSEPFGVALSPNGSYAYVANYGNSTVSLCSVGATGTLTGCASTGSGFSGPAGVNLSANGSYAYVTNISGGTVTQCSVGAAGALTGCASTASGFSDPYGGVALSPNGSYAYVTDYGNSTVTQCSVGATGALTGCASTGSGFSNPMGMAFN